MLKNSIRLLKLLVFPLCLVPFARLAWFSYQQNVGADPVATITHVTGRWTLYFLLISLAVTPLRRLHPSLGWLIRFRRMLGLFAFFYATLHLCTYVFLFSDLDVPGAWANLQQHDWAAFRAQWALPIATMQDDILRRKFIQVGLFAWFLLLILALTSPAFLMRRMGGTAWRRVHWLVYVAAVAGIIHFWWLVKPGVLRPLNATIVLAILLLARILWFVKKRVSAAPVRN